MVFIWVRFSRCRTRPAGGHHHQFAAGFAQAAGSERDHADARAVNVRHRRHIQHDPPASPLHQFLDERLNALALAAEFQVPAEFHDGDVRLNLSFRDLEQHRRVWIAYRARRHSTTESLVAAR